MLNELIKGEADRVARLADADRFQHAGVAELHQHQLVVKVVGHLLRIRLDAPHKEGIGVTQSVHQLLQRLLKLVRHRGRLLAGGPRRRWGDVQRRRRN